MPKRSKLLPNMLLFGWIQQYNAPTASALQIIGVNLVFDENQPVYMLNLMD